MKIVYRGFKKTLVSSIVILISLFLIFPCVHYNYNLNILAEIENDLGNNEVLSYAQGPINDTTAPIIIFIQPTENNTIIKQKSYNIIVNITDDNPPSYGNVTIQISNQTSFLYNDTMNYDGGRQWSYNWDNISLYPNYNFYNIKIWAKDSSPNENHIWSDEFQIVIRISTGPSFLHFLLYIVVVSVIFSLIIVYMNKKAIFRTSKKQKKNSQEIYEY